MVIVGAMLARTANYVLSAATHTVGRHNHGLLLSDPGHANEVRSFRVHDHYVLMDDHASFQWRRTAGRASPPVGKATDRVLLFVLHDRVGIGNALGGVSQALMMALQNDQTLVVNSFTNNCLLNF